ncbi:MAG: hypothetical protein M3042_10095 [Actinomycetota bacterium]|nr:hypothetical protein [Actinomycetota bacterium]
MSDHQPTAPGAGTGDARIDAALEQLVGLDHEPVSEHPQRYDEVHTALQDTLYSLDED